MKMIFKALPGLALCWCTTAWAQVLIGLDPTNRFAWSENTGWVNFSPTNVGGQLHYLETNGFLSGHAWQENIGWIKLAADTNGPFANDSATNWGVNLDENGAMSGYAWSENTGWIKFNPTHGGVAMDMVTGQFDGYAWGENIGWLKFKGTAPAYNVRTSEAEKQTQTITFDPIATQFSTNTLGLFASASSGLPVSFTTNGGPAIITDGTNLAFTAHGNVTVLASQPGTFQLHAAPDVTNTFMVHGVPQIGSLTLFRATNSPRVKISELMMLTNAVDPESSAMTVIWVSAGTTNGGTVTLSGHWLTYTPPAGNDSPDAFQFRVRNAFGGVGEGTADMLVIVPENEGQTLNISSLSPSATNTLVRFVGIPGRNYDVQSTTNLVDAPWQKIGEITIGGQGYVVFTDTNPPVSQYYRTARPE